MKDKNPKIISIHWPDEEQPKGSIRAPTGLKVTIDKFLETLQKHTGVKFTRNEIIIKAIRHYLKHLSDAVSRSELIKKMEDN